MSGRKNFFIGHPINAQSVASNISGTIYNIQGLDNFGLQFNVTGGTSPSGTISVTVSNDYNPNTGTGTFTALTTTYAISANGTTIAQINQLPFAYMQINYAKTSGTGTLDVWICGKML